MKHLLLTTIAAVLLVGCGESSIHGAAEEGNIEAVKQHLAAGTDVNTKDNSEWTPLHHVVFYGYKEIAELLIDNGADVNAKGDGGRTPLDWSHKHPETSDLIRKHGGKTKSEL